MVGKNDVQKFRGKIILKPLVSRQWRTQLIKISWWWSFISLAKEFHDAFIGLALGKKGVVLKTVFLKWKGMVWFYWKKIRGRWRLEVEESVRTRERGMMRSLSLLSFFQIHLTSNSICEGKLLSFISFIFSCFSSMS